MTLPARHAATLAIHAVLMATGLALAFASSRFQAESAADPGPGLAVLGLGGLLAVLAGINLVTEALRPSPEGEMGLGASLLGVLAALVVYLLAIPLLGLFLATGLFAGAVVLAVERKPLWLRAGLTAAITTGLAWLLLGFLLQTPLP